MTQRTKLLLLIPHLGGGGAEQVVAQLALRLDPQRFEIHLALMTEDLPGAQPIPVSAQIHRFHRKRVRQGAVRLVRLVRTLQPDVVLSGMAHLNFLLLLLKPSLPRHTAILVRQNTTASSAAKTWLTRLSYRGLYPLADAILCQSQAMANDLAKHFAIAPQNLHVLANPIDLQAIRAATSSSRFPSPTSSGPRLLAVARLAPEKGLDLLINALKTIRDRHPYTYLEIAGTGPEEAALRKLCAELRLEDAVTFSGHKLNLAESFIRASLFVLPSRYEGMPNALLEAAAAGLPLVATPCSGGLCDLLRKQPGAWLSTDISAESLAEAILTALNALQIATPGHPAAVQRFSHAFLEPFDAPAAIAAYAALIERYATRGKPCAA